MRSAFFPAQQQGQHGEAASPGDHVHSSKRATFTHTNSPSREHVAPGSISRTTVSSASRTLRFPSSRRYLWDRTAAGPQVLVDLLDYLPHVQVAASTFGAVSRAASSKSSSFTLQLDLSVSDTNQVAALIQEHDPLSVHSSLQLSCALTQPGAVPPDAVSGLRAAVQAHLDQRDIARVEQLYALSASASAAASPAEPTSLRLQLLMPRVGLLATPLYTKRLCHVPLAETLLKPGCMAAGQTGYLSMDQARSLLPMQATDANVYSTPLVGVWVKGPAGVLHPLVAAACWRFAYSSLLIDRAVNPEDGAFLLLLCPEGDPVSKCYEVHMTDNSKLELCCYRLEAGVRPAGGLSQYPGGLVSATWVPEQRQIQALPGTLTAAAAAEAALPAGAGAARHVQSTTATGAAARSVGLLLGSSAHGPAAAAAAADSPVVQRYSQLSRAAELPLGRSSAPSATFGYGGAGSLHNNGAGAAAATAARRSLPLTYGGGAHSSSFGAPATADRPWLGHSSTAGLPPGWPEEPQPRAGVPAVAYMPGSQAHTDRQHWRQHQQQQPDSEAHWSHHHHQQQQRQLQESPRQYPVEVAPAHAAVTEPSQLGAGSGGPGFSSTCSSPTKACRQQQLTWSDRQDQVLRSSLEGAAEALRSSQASLAAAREAASGAGSRLGSPTKGRSTAGDAPASATTAQPDYGPCDPVGAADEAATAQQRQHSPGGAADASASPQPALSRLGGQQQQHADVDAESDCGPRMGSPVRASVQKKASMLAAAAAHAAGVPATEGPGQRPVSPAVQAGVALSNLSLLQHLSSGQLQQALQHSPSPHSQQQQQQQLCLQGDHVLETVGHAAVAASAGHPAAGTSHYEHQREAADMAWQQRQQTRQPAEAHMLHAVSHASAPSAGAAVRDSMQASHAAAAAIQAASSSMQRSPVHPYSHSLGVQRYAADVATMQHSSQASPGTHGLLSPGSSPGMVDSSARWQPLQLPYMQQQQQGLGSSMRGLPSAWAPSLAAAAAGGGAALGNSSSMGSPYWQQQQQQCHVMQQVSPVSAGLSPGYAAADPVTAALQGEVDRLRQQLQQLQYQLRLAGMTLRGPDLEAAATSSTPQPLAAAAAGPGAAAAGQHAQLTAVMQQAPSPHLMQQQHLEGIPNAGPAPLVDSSVVVAALEACPLAPQQGEPQQLLGSGAEQAWLRGQQYPAVSYTRHGAGGPAAAGFEPSTAAAADAGAPHSQQPAAGHQPAAGSAPLAGVTLHVAAGGKAHPNSRYSSADVSPVQQAVVANSATDVAAAAAAAAAAHPVQQQPQQQGSQNSSAVDIDGAAAAAAGSRAPDAECTQEQQQQQHNQAVAEQQLAAANAAAARQRRRKLDFSAAGCSANADNADSSISDEAGVAPVESDTADSSAAAASPAAKAAAPTAKEASGAGQDQWVAPPAPAAHVPSSTSHEAAVNPCDSPAAVCTRPAAHVDAGASPLQAASATAARGRGSGGALNSSAAGVRHSIRSSVGGGLGHLRASLDAPALVEVVRTRVVELSDDSDEGEWEDRLLLKYGLK